MDKKPILLDFFPEEIEQALSKQPKFRAKQVFSWLHKGSSFSEMLNLPLSLRNELTETYIDIPVKIQFHISSKQDDTVKFLYALNDGNIVEGVLMHYRYGYSLCVSTQVGCRMGCTFCASTLEGCARNLTAGEMLGQVNCANQFIKEQKNSDERVGHIVLMGSGEPLDNYDQTLKFLKLVNHKDGLNIGMRHISVSTCGLVPQIKKLTQEKLGVTLSISLHATNNEVRKTMMPITNAYSVETLIQAAKDYIEYTGRRVVFEYALVANVNSSKKDAQDLANLLKGMKCHVNLIPLNKVSERNLYSATRTNANEFLNVLLANHISATIRREMGNDIEGACGQLRRSHLQTIN